MDVPYAPRVIELRRLMAAKLETTDNRIAEIEKLFEGDQELLLFFFTWLANDRNATKSYRVLHPEVTAGSAEVLGSRVLGKVRERVGLADIASIYGLDLNMYMEQLMNGNKAEKRDQFSGEMYPDHAVRLKYHDKLGKLLNIETPENQTNVQVNISPLLGGQSVSSNNSDQKDTGTNQED